MYFVGGTLVAQGSAIVVGLSSLQVVYWIYISLALPYFGIVVDTILLNV